MTTETPRMVKCPHMWFKESGNFDDSIERFYCQMCLTKIKVTRDKIGEIIDWKVTGYGTTIK